MTDWIFAIFNLDAFQSIRTPDATLNEKRQRERKMVAATLASLLNLALAVLFGAPLHEAPSSAGYISSLVSYWTGILFLAFASLSLLWFCVEWVAYLMFCKREGY